MSHFMSILQLTNKAICLFDRKTSFFIKHNFNLDLVFGWLGKSL